MSQELMMLLLKTEMKENGFPKRGTLAIIQGVED